MVLETSNVASLAGVPKSPTLLRLRMIYFVKHVHLMGISIVENVQSIHPTMQEPLLSKHLSYSLGEYFPLWFTSTNCAVQLPFLVQALDRFDCMIV